MEEQWTTVIRPKNKWYDLKLNEIWKYRDLIFLFVKRNFSTRYKQTILGPAWLVISPLFTVFAYTIVFGGIAGLSTDGVPKPLFYLAGNIMWCFFAGCLSQTSATFTGNAGIFGKVYFPRMVTPISIIITATIDFLIQFLLFLVIVAIYCIKGESINCNITILLLPLLLLQLAMFGMGFGIIISSLTTKYRDLSVLVGFGLQIWMYVSPVIYSTSLVPSKFMTLFMLNPVTPVILTFKYAVFGIGYIPWFYIGISWLVTLFVLFLGMIIFNQVEKTFMDTV